MNPFLISVPAAVLATGGVAAYGAAFPRAQLFGPTICRTNSPRKLAITFDDGPNPAITPKLLDLLDRYRAKATFFLGDTPSATTRNHTGTSSSSAPLKSLSNCGSATTPLRTPSALPRNGFVRPMAFAIPG